MLKFTRLSIIAMALAFWPLVAGATEVELTPSTINGWKVQNYIGSQGIYLWTFTTICGNPNGPLFLPARATAGERERLWSLMSAAKLSGKAIFIYFNDGVGGGVCGTITSFGYRAT